MSITEPIRNWKKKQQQKKKTTKKKKNNNKKKKKKKKQQKIQYWASANYRSAMPFWSQRAPKRALAFLNASQECYTKLLCDLYVVFVYLPPSTYGKVHGQEIMQKLEKQIEYFTRKGKVIICGDLNARVADKVDIIQKRLPVSSVTEWQYLWIYFTPCIFW